MNKKELRQLYASKRLQITPQQLLVWDDLMLIHFQRLAFYHNLQLLFSYFPLAEKAETDPHLFERSLQFSYPGLQVAYPVIDVAACTMQAHLLNDQQEITINQYNIEEPLHGIAVEAGEIDVVFVPLLAFDKQGYRVGYGKGFYDRFLQTCSKEVISIGFSYFDPVAAIDDLQQFDVPLNYCITPHHLYEF